MNRIYHLHRSLSLLLWLLVVFGARAQTLEYWFDDTVDPKSLLLTGGKVDTDINVKHLETGLHTLNLRAKSGSDYSPVSTSTFLKFQPRSASEIEYWFDGDLEKLASMPIDTETETVQIFDLDLTDSKKFPLGIHQLSMRIVTTDGVYSPVYNALVMRMPGGTGNTVLEYWFDNNRSNPGTIPVDIKSGTLQVLDLDMTNLTNFPYGLHKLNMRVAAYGNQYSPVYSAFVMRLPMGATNQITYWLDDDYQNGKRVVTSYLLDQQGRHFIPNLNFSGASPGMHRLMVRVTTNGVDHGVVYETPVLVTRKYAKKTKDEVVTVVGESRRVDDLTGIWDNSFVPQSLLVRYFDLNPDNYGVGQHELHLQYSNSSDVFSAENITYFYKEKANGRLYAGIMPGDEKTGIDDVSQSDDVLCAYDNGTIFLDCQSAKLGKTGVVTLCDMAGRVVVQQKVDNENGGIHAEINVEHLARQLMIVRFVSGDVRFSQKVIIR